MDIFGSCEAHPFHSKRCNKAEENTCSTKYAKSSYIIGLRSNQHTKIHEIINWFFFLTRIPVSKSGSIVNFIILHQFRQLKGVQFLRLGVNPHHNPKAKFPLASFILFQSLSKDRWNVCFQVWNILGFLYCSVHSLYP